MKTLAEDLNNIAVLNEVEMSQIFGGCEGPTEDEEVWL